MAAATLYLSPSQYSQHFKPIGPQLDPYNEMVRTLASTSDYASLATGSADRNPTLLAALKSFTRSASFTASSPEKRARHDSSVLFVFAFIIDLLTRLLNPKIWCFSIMLLTLAATRYMIPTPFWKILVACRLLYSKKIGVEVAQDLGRFVLSGWPTWASTVVGIAVFDNCAYSLRSNHEHVDPTRRTLFYQTINWFYTFAVGQWDSELLAPGGGVVKAGLHTAALPEYRSMGCNSSVLFANT